MPTLRRLGIAVPRRLFFYGYLFAVRHGASLSAVIFQCGFRGGRCNSETFHHVINGHAVMQTVVRYQQFTRKHIRLPFGILIRFMRHVFFVQDIPIDCDEECDVKFHGQLSIWQNRPHGRPCRRTPLL